MKSGTISPTNASSSDASLAGLGELLQLDYDAIAAYAVALSLLDDPDHQEAVRGFKADHERHVDEFSQLILGHGGIPGPVPHVSGPFKLGVQSAGAGSNAREMLAALRAHERHIRDKYNHVAAKRHPDAVADVIRRAAGDEERHYQWAVRALQDDPRVTANAQRKLKQAGPARLAAAGLIIVSAVASMLLKRRSWK